MSKARLMFKNRNSFTKDINFLSDSHPLYLSCGSTKNNMTKTAFAFILACCLSSFSSYGQAAAFKTFINSIEDESTLIPSLVKDFVKITAIEELDYKSSLELLDFKRTRNYYGLLIGFENKMKCQMAYFVTLDRNGMMIDFAKTTEMCEIDLDAQRHNTIEGTLDGDIIAIMKEEEVALT